MKTTLEVAEKCPSNLTFSAELMELKADILSERQTTPDMIRGAGFNLFVSPEFALKFKYTATIYTLAQDMGRVHTDRHLVVDAIEDPESHWGHKFINGGMSEALLFNGELPLWVVNKVRIAVGMGIRDITIHSNDKGIEADIVKADPAIVGWVGFSPLWDWLIKNKGKMPRWYYSWKKKQPHDAFGFIIAIFGGGEVI